MDFELTDDQQAVMDAVGALLARQAGTVRAVELAAKGGYDDELERAFQTAGFAALFSEVGPLGAGLAVEAAARAGAVAGLGASLFVAPGVLDGRGLEGPVALASASGSGVIPPVRYGAHARHVLVDRGEEAALLRIEPGEAESVPSTFGFPFGRLPAEVANRAEAIGAEGGARLRRFWRTALALEIVGTARAALDATLAHVKERRQFGRAIGSFQAVQHRLVDAFVRVEGTRWLACEAADLGAPAEAAAVAATHAAGTAKLVFDETHQFSGAMGFTREHPLHVFTMRLQALRLELGGVAAHARAATAARWLARP